MSNFERMELAAEHQERMFWGDGNVSYLDCGKGYMTVYLWENSLNCTLKMAQLYVNYNSVKLINQTQKKTSIEAYMVV